MIMTPRLSKFTLTTHVTASVGWLGAVGAFLALAIGGVTSDDAQLVGAAYVTTEFITWFVIVPLSFAALLTGILQSLGTTWGLFRHYWVVAKLAVTVIATGLLLVHTQAIGLVARAAAAHDLAIDELHGLRVQLIADAAAGVVALLITTTLSIYKPWGLTAYGERHLSAHGVPAQIATPRWVQVSWTVAAVLILIVIALHLTGHGLGHH